MKPNWSAIIMSALTVVVGLGCAVLALSWGKGDATASAVLWSAAGTALGSFLRQPQSLGNSKGNDVS